MNNIIDELISEAVDFLSKRQENDGSFLSKTSSDNFLTSQNRPTVFQNGIILSALSKTNSKSFELNKITKKLSLYLLGQLSDLGSFNYWDRKSKEFAKFPYPDDLDDTSCCLGALQMHNPEKISGEILAKVTKLLTALEIKEGGPYRTWLVPEASDKAWLDVDLAVNSNISYFLSLNDVKLPNLVKFIDNKIAQDKIESPYYYGSLPLIYFISRGYNGSKKIRLIEKIHSNKKSNTLEYAISITSLINLGEPPEKIMPLAKKLITLLRKKKYGSYPFVIELVKDKTQSISGSSYLTCAMAIEALSKLQRSYALNANEIIDKDSETIEQKVKEMYHKKAAALPHNLQHIFLNFFDKLTKKDKHKQIILTPCYYWIATGKPRRSRYKDALTELGLANLYGWVAYTIYDDFYDEDGDPRLLPVANIALRELTKIFDSTSYNASFRKLKDGILDKIDTANHWEFTYCKKTIHNNILKVDRLPDFEDLSVLADKSLGHALGPIALASASFKDDSEILNLLKFYKNFIIAKQLNDDMHDWEEDLKNGIITYPISLLIKNMKTAEIDITKNDNLKKVFWEFIVPQTSRRLLLHTRRAKDYLTQLKLKNPTILTNLVEILEDSAKTAIEERKKTLEFIRQLDS